ncbi:YlxM family DNA-binding protein [Cohnella candidum]|uniref:UPF0122 protein EAV92_04860 n=1 Tax=Cohnella candidum TaxID=2674991 RepID=A0A3G3JUN4_9BACL|nr:YlxM family DNA-binding protein [Cohnella candidum]AYQ71953.1 HTH domain-containing protein [Cohnella candidum]
MQGENSLEKTNRINVLFDFYGPLLTEKQQTFLKCYFHDDFSLGEIAAEFEISRQAVYEHLKRAEQMLENYEEKLGLAYRHEKLQEGLDQLEHEIGRLPSSQQRPLLEAAARLRD